MISIGRRLSDLIDWSDLAIHWTSGTSDQIPTFLSFVALERSRGVGFIGVPESALA